MKNTKGYDKVTVIGVAVSVIAFVLILLFRPGMPANNASNDDAGETQEAVQAAGEQASPSSPTPAEVPVQYVQADVTSPRKDIPVEQSVLAGGSNVSVFVDRQGNGVSSVRLEDYLLEAPRKGKEKSGSVVLSNYDYPFLALSCCGDKGLVLEAPQASGDDGKELSLTRLSSDGRLRAHENWSVSEEHPGEIKYSVTFENISESAVLVSGYRLEGSAIPASVSARKAGRGEAAGGVSVCINGKAKDFSMKNLVKMKDDERADLAMTPAEWAAVHSKYFVMAFWMDGKGAFPGIECAAVPGMPVEGSENLPASRYHVRALLPAFELGAGASNTISITGYAGPKMYDRLNAYGNGLVSVMDMDRFFFWRPAWMRAISGILLKMLVWISELFPKSIGYGMAVILLTVLVKGIFWPLSHKSTASMRKMQALKPQLDEMRAKYKDDPQTMYRKQQELFKENNVSQLGGCLPMLFQIPVFFALYNTFRNAIEMRHASFLWAYDLSVPDTVFELFALPVRPLALLMGLAMFYQQKLTPNPDPQQARMMNFMSIFFIFLFYGMPSALTLYLTVSYVLGIVQTVLTNKMLPPVVVAGDAPAKRK